MWKSNHSERHIRHTTDYTIAKHQTSGWRDEDNLQLTHFRRVCIIYLKANATHLSKSFSSLSCYSLSFVPSFSFSLSLSHYASIELAIFDREWMRNYIFAKWKNSQSVKICSAEFCCFHSFTDLRLCDERLKTFVGTIKHSTRQRHLLKISDCSSRFDESLTRAKPNNSTVCSHCRRLPPIES